MAYLLNAPARRMFDWNEGRTGAVALRSNLDVPVHFSFLPLLYYANFLEKVKGEIYISKIFILKPPY